ncbi:MAG: serine O-acetyltransferase [Spirochaetales bacterium]|nr:serine O-acetyltransferase [Spirochaetales bacterium]
MDQLPREIWNQILEEAREESKKEPLLSSFLYQTILNHQFMGDALSYHLTHKLENPTLPGLMLREIIDSAFRQAPDLLNSVSLDLKAIRQRDPASYSYATAFLYFKGFHALESYRVTHWLWKQDRKSLAHLFQSRISEVFGVDIHPAAQIGSGILMDHASSIVIGETAVIEDNVSMLHEVTLGGTGKEEGDRHPKIRQGVLIGAGAKILGNIVIGEGAKIGAGSVVLADVPPHSTVAGVPAKKVGSTRYENPALEMDHRFCEES